MFTLIYLNGQFNRPDTMVPFLQFNAGGASMQVDCITPFPWCKDDLIKAVCEYLNKIDPNIEVTHYSTGYPSTDSKPEGDFVNYLAKVHVQQK